MVEHRNQRAGVRGSTDGKKTTAIAPKKNTPKVTGGRAVPLARLVPNNFITSRTGENWMDGLFLMQPEQMPDFPYIIEHPTTTNRSPFFRRLSKQQVERMETLRATNAMPRENVRSALALTIRTSSCYLSDTGGVKNLFPHFL